MRYLLIAILCFTIAGFASLGFTDEYEYVPGEYTNEDSVQGKVLVTTTVAEMKAEYFSLKSEKEYLQEVIANQIKIRDAAVATGTDANDRIQAINAKMAALKAAYEAWVEAANIPEPEPEGE